MKANDTQVGDQSQGCPEQARRIARALRIVVVRSRHPSRVCERDHGMSQRIAENHHSATLISVGEGIAASQEDRDAMFQPRPHAAIAVAPNAHHHGSKVNSSRALLRPQSF
jgi:hypothetical protein